MHAQPLDDVLILLLLAVVAVAAFRRFNLPPILGYLFVGIVAGPYAFGWIQQSEAITILGEIGVVFLLFMIGLEISVPTLLSMRKAVLGFGGTQMVLSTASAMFIAWMIGIPLEGALAVGGALALSSTAIVAKQLTEQVELQSRHGRLSFGILLFQDLAVVPFLVVIPILAAGSDTNLGVVLGMELGKGVLVIVAMLWLGRRILRPLLHWVAGAHSVELFTLAVLLISLTAAWATFFVGLSLALGAFIAGMLIGDTEYKHHVESEIRPFRDILMGLFFITVGMHLDVFSLPQNWYWVLLLLVGVMVGKGLLIAILVYLGGEERGVALRTGIVLGQAGEFGFALIALALTHGLLADPQAQPVLAAAVLSMVIAPLLIRRNGALSRRFSRSYRERKSAEAPEIEQAASELSDHVIICGFGRIGQNLALFLDAESIEYLALDMDPHLIGKAWEAGQRAFFASAAQPAILEAAGLNRARALVITFDDPISAEHIIRSVRGVNATIPVIVRTHDDIHMEELEQAGATEVVPESIEASIMLARHLLHQIGVDGDEIQRVIDQARADHYERVRGYFHGTADILGEADTHFHRHSVALSDGDTGVGRMLAEIPLDDLGVQVTSVRRSGVVGERPDPEMQLRAGDILILQGDPDNLRAAERLLLQDQNH